MPETARHPNEAVDRLLEKGGHVGQLLASLSPQSQAEFRRLVRLKTVPARTTLVHEGEEPTEIGYVLSGTLAMTKLLPDGRVHIIGLLQSLATTRSTSSRSGRRVMRWIG